MDPLLNDLVLLQALQIMAKAAARSRAANAGAPRPEVPRAHRIRRVLARLGDILILVGTRLKAERPEAEPRAVK